jgi:TPR repeat protein
VRTTAFSLQQEDTPAENPMNRPKTPKESPTYRLPQGEQEEQDWQMKLIPFLLLIGILAVSGWAEIAKRVPYSAELVEKAEAGDAVAQNNLGVYYAEGLVVTKNYKEAVKWYTKSAERGNVLGQYNLGTCYANGRGIAKDYKEALNWYTKAAEQGDATAMSNIGVLYYQGKGVAKDDKEAVKWLTKAVERGHVGSKPLLEKLKSK